MKYITILDTDDYIDFEFFEDGNGKYLHAVDANAMNGEWVYLPFKPLEQEYSDKQRYVVKGINNDKIEFVDKYSVRAFNRYIKFIKNNKNVVLDKIRAEINKIYEREGSSFDCLNALDELKEFIDKCKAESEET